MKISWDELEQELLADNMTGFCRSCGEIADCVEPDACNYECEACGEYEVFGCQELLIMGEFEE